MTHIKRATRIYSATSRESDVNLAQGPKTHLTDTELLNQPNEMRHRPIGKVQAPDPECGVGGRILKICRSGQPVCFNASSWRLRSGHRLFVDPDGCHDSKSFRRRASLTGLSDTRSI